ncbi:MAG: pyridoxamine 5'-phosphate oxidase family protein [Sphingomonadales bacterium]|nr:pyridoxamine 5'-phosphate oxidase family protein [Sphingomonadales bacterium]
MADYFDSLEEKHHKFIKKQLMFTVATAPLEGRINISPKGLDAFRIIDNKTVAYLDTIGSSNETAAHLRVDNRITIMFMSFDRNPLIMRIYGKGEALQTNTEEFKALIELFPETSGVRQIIKINIDNLSTNCGYGVPLMENAQERPTLETWANTKDEKALNAYMRKNNLTSIDGLDTGLVVED